MITSGPGSSRAAVVEELGWLTSWAARVCLLAEQADQLPDDELRRQLARHLQRARRHPALAAEIERKRAAQFRESGTRP